MIRRLLRIHGDLLMNAVVYAIAIACLLLGYGERQQADERAAQRLDPHSAALNTPHPPRPNTSRTGEPQS